MEVLRALHARKTSIFAYDSLPHMEDALNSFDTIPKNQYTYGSALIGEGETDCALHPYDRQGADQCEEE